MDTFSRDPQNSGLIPASFTNASREKETAIELTLTKSLRIYNLSDFIKQLVYDANKFGISWQIASQPSTDQANGKDPDCCRISLKLKGSKINIDNLLSNLDKNEKQRQEARRISMYYVFHSDEDYTL